MSVATFTRDAISRGLGLTGRLAVAALAALPTLTGCGDGLAPSPTLPEMIAILQAAPDTVAHSGLRRFESHYALEGVQYDQEYTEEVWFDGQGRYSIQPDRVLSHPTLPPDLFAQLQRARAGFVHRYRDFRLVDPLAFGSNYAFTSLGQPITYLGRVAWNVEIQRKADVGGQSGGRRYLLTTDVETGLVLACEERSADGALLSRMAYESIDFAPELSDVDWHVPDNQEQRLELTVPIAGQVAFPVLVPKLLPAGYKPFEVATVVDTDGRTWLKTTLTDGVESLFFVQAEPEPAPPSSTDIDSIIGAPIQDDHVYVWQAGSVTVMQGTVMGFDLIAVGKVGEDALLELLDSALP
jgi:hypothetical protein